MLGGGKALQIGKWSARILLLLASVLFLSTSVRWGWTRVETDFPNYYTAAVLARRHLPLRSFYDWPWFQRQMNYTGTERQLGGYIPYTPLTLLPILPLSWLAPQAAKQVWLLLNLGFLAASIGILARVTQTSVVRLGFILALGFYAVHENFLLGQNYVFMLWLFTIAVWCLVNNRDFTCGVVLGIICALKLYSAPFILYFAWKRRWRAASGMVVTCVLLAGISVAMFGWKDNYYFVTQVAPRALSGEILDPYNSGIGALTTLLRRALLVEPELNPRPLFYSPTAFFVLRPLLVLMVLGLAVLCLPRQTSTNEKRDFAWFMIGLMVLSPYTAPYLFVLLYLPIVLLMGHARPAGRVWLALSFAILAAPLYPPWWSELYPKAFVMLALFIAIGHTYWRNLRSRDVIWAGLVVLALTAWDARTHLSSYYQEPAQKFGRIAVEEGAIYSSSPAVAQNEIVYESIGDGRYVLRRVSSAGKSSLAFEGHAFHPALPVAGGVIYFELVSHRSSRIVKVDPATGKLEIVVPPSMLPTQPSVAQDGKLLAFVSDGHLVIYDRGGLTKLATGGTVQDPVFFPRGDEVAYSSQCRSHWCIFAADIATGKSIQLTQGPGDHSEPAVSPDGKYLAFTSNESGPKQIWVENLSTGGQAPLTGGLCNSFSPAWQPDAHRLVFASDCGRGLGLPALYSAAAPIAASASR